MSEDEISPKAKVIQLKRNDKKQGKIATSVLYRELCEAINKGLHGLPEFPVNFLCISPQEGVKFPMIEDANEVCRKVPKDILAQEILKYCCTISGDYENYKFICKDATACADFWLAITDPVEEPAPIRWLNEPGRCYSRLPFDYQTDDTGELTPLFNEILSRTSDPEVLMCFIGSLFFPQSYLQQYLFLFGDGGDGKGALMRILKQAFKLAYHTENIPGIYGPDKFWTSSFIGKRVVCFSDADNSNFITTGLFKSMTGGDGIRMEEKGGKIFNAELTTKFILLANHKPKISAKKADTRRILYCEVKPASEMSLVPSDYEKALWREAGYFFSNCIQIYLDTCPQHQSIPFDTSDVVTWATADDDEMQLRFDEVFEYRAPLPGELERDRPSVSPTQFELRLNFLFKDQARARKEFRGWVETAYGVHKKRVRNPDGTFDNKYVGLIAKDIPQESRLGR